MKKLYQNSLKGRITFSYGFVFFLLIILLSIFYYFTAYHTFLENHERNSLQLAKVISYRVDESIQSVNALQKRILESEDILDYIFEKSSLHDVVYDWKFQRDLYSITGYNYEFYHMNIFNPDTNILLTFGENYYNRDYSVTPEITRQIIEPTLELSGAIKIFPPGSGCLYAPNEDLPVITVCRSFKPSLLSQKDGLIEIQIAEDSIEKIIQSTLYSFENGGERVLLFDSDNRAVFPSDISEEQLSYYAALNTDSQSMFRPSSFSEKEMVTSYISSETGITTLLITPVSYLIKNRLFYLGVCLVFFFCTFLLLVFITQRLALRITNPVTELKNRISSLELEQISEENFDYASDSTFDELEILNESYNRMQHRLKKSLDDVIRSRTLTVQSQMLALQAQMDAHFLYNTLTIISIIAENNNDLPASQMCVKLTQMLRYISEDTSKDTLFSQEIQHTRNYTDLISVRFGSGVDFQYILAPEMEDILVPRLIIQPIVENCVKYSRKPDQVLRITIRSWKDQSHWYVKIQDNGDGFSEKALNMVKDRIARLDPENKSPDLHINGMGLVNIFLRLKIYYTEQFIFELGNQMEDTDMPGASIIIGGMLNETR